jgi:predicted nucleic acid-binding protein
LGAVAYLDSSAIVKLVKGEPETSALRTELEHWPQYASSRLAEIEVTRAALYFGHTARRRARDVLRSMSLIAIDDEVITQAGALLPPTLRTLDAIHVATALLLGNDLGVLMTYDRRMDAVAKSYNLPRLAPGQ